MPIRLDDLTANPDILDHLAAITEFELVTGVAEPPFCSVAGETDLAVFAHDGSGGQFVLAPASGRVFFFSSEGQGGLIAESLGALVTLLAHRPDWMDLLKYSARGRLDEMRRAAEAFDDYDGPDPERIAAGELIAQELGLTAPADAVGALHRAVATPLTILDPVDAPADSLFGRFTIDDNPMLRRS
jgi:hypothetical protein